MKKVYGSAAEALEGLLTDGMVIAAGGFGLCGIPENLIAAMETLEDVAVGGAKGVTFEEGDHRGTRQEGIIQAQDGEFVQVKEFRPYPDVVFETPAN